MLANEVHLFYALEFLTHNVFIEGDLKSFLLGVARGVSSHTKPNVFKSI